jgi:PAS domain S-box-containing protein
MDQQSLSTVLRRPFTRASALFGMSACALGAAVLLYRTLDLAALQPFVAFALHGVRAPTGVALAIGGLAFLGLHRGMDRPLARNLSLAGGVAVAALGVAGLATSGRGGSGELEALPIALALVLIGAALPWAALRPYNSLTVQLAGGTALMISLLVLLGRAYSARPLYELGGDMPARVGSALGCALLALALLLARPEYAISRVLAGRSLGADHLRRTLPALLGVPIAVGLLALSGLRAGWYGEHVAFAVFTLLGMAALGLLGATSARRIDLVAREREALEGLFQRTFDNASVGVGRLDDEGRWGHVNARLCEIVGWPREELVGRRAEEITHPDDVAAQRAALAPVVRGEADSQHLEQRYVTQQGQPVWVDAFVSAERDPDGRIGGYVVIVQDIGDRKRAERAKDEFFALVSHELRSPLHVLGGWLAVLRQDGSPEVRARALAIAERSAALLNRLIGDLLDASRIASGKLEIERDVFDLQEVVQAVVAAFQPLAAAREIELRLALPAQTPFVAGDAERIEQVVRNLVDNALKFTEPGGRVQVTLARAGGEASIRVEDTGQGIAPDLLPHVFERLRQGAGGPRGAARGLGLGLSIVRHLVGLHGGRIEAHSDGPGRGARFEVRLPETPIPQRLAPLSVGEESDVLDGVPVLIVKPDRSAAEAVALALEACDANVDWVRTGEEALSRARERRPRVVIADLDAAPEADPSEPIFAGDWGNWLRALRSELDTPPAAIALSAGDHLAGRRLARAAGFDAFLGRPAEPRRLLATIQALLAGPRRVLVVDDDHDAADSLAIRLARRGYEVERAYAFSDALEVAARFRPSAVLTDLQLAGEDGVELVRALRAGALHGARFIAVSGRSLEELGPDAKLFDGAVRKPFDLDALLALLRSAS